MWALWDRRNNRIVLSEIFCCGNLSRPIQIMLLLSLKIITIQNQIYTIFSLNFFLCVCVCIFFYSSWVVWNTSAHTWLLKLNKGNVLNPAIECGNHLLLLLKPFSCVITYFLVVLQDIFNLQRLKHASLVAAMSVVENDLLPWDSSIWGFLGGGTSCRATSTACYGMSKLTVFLHHVSLPLFPITSLVSRSLPPTEPQKRPL